MDACQEFVRSLCASLKVKNITAKNFGEICAKYSVKALGSGAQGSCSLLKGKDKSYVVKNYSNSDLTTLATEVRFLSKFKDVNGVQQLVGVCVENRSLLTKFAGHSIDTQKINQHSLMTILKQLAKIVDEINSLDIHHNDLKCANVCVQRTAAGPKVTVIDFGLATTASSPLLDEPMGPREAQKYPWVAPEVLAGESSSSASDTFSVAFVARTLFNEAKLTMPSRLDSWVNDALSPNPVVRPTLSQLIDVLSQ